MRWTVAAICAALLAVAGFATGKQELASFVPNASAISTLGGYSSSCQTCHVNENGGLLNPFGAQVRDTRTGGLPDWSRLYNLDADGDGFSNGYELGDPAGQWRAGQPDPMGTVTHPADAASKSSTPSAIQHIRTPTAWAVIKALFR